MSKTQKPYQWMHGVYLMAIVKFFSFNKFLEYLRNTRPVLGSLPIKNLL